MAAHTDQKLSINTSLSVPTGEPSPCLGKGREAAGSPQLPTPRVEDYHTEVNSKLDDWIHRMETVLNEQPPLSPPSRSSSTSPHSNVSTRDDLRASLYGKENLSRMSRTMSAGSQIPSPLPADGMAEYMEVLEQDIRSMLPPCHTDSADSLQPSSPSPSPQASRSRSHRSHHYKTGTKQAGSRDGIVVVEREEGGERGDNNSGGVTDEMKGGDGRGESKRGGGVGKRKKGGASANGSAVSANESESAVSASESVVSRSETAVSRSGTNLSVEIPSRKTDDRGLASLMAPPRMCLCL